MKKVIIISIALMTVLMGCSFSNNPKNEPQTVTTADTSIPEEIFQKEILVSTPESLAAFIRNMSSADLNKNFHDGTTPLEVAAIRGNSDVIRMLIKAGALPFTLNSKTNTSLFYEVLNTPKEQQAKSIFLTKSLAVSDALSFVERMLSRALSRRLEDDFVNIAIDKKLPSSVVLKIFASRGSRTKISIANIERMLSAPSFKDDLSFPKYLKNPYRLFFQELENQLNESFPTLSLLEFISKKTPHIVYGYDHYNDQENRTYWVNPGLLLEWRNIKTAARHQSSSKQIASLSNFPPEIAVFYCTGECKSISEATSSITIDALKNDERFFGNTILDDALSARGDSFWDTSNKEDEE